MSAPTGSGIGDFEFLAGEWTIENRRLVEPNDGGAPTWDEFEGEATVHSLLGGLASIEELRIPARGFSGMGVRVFDIERGQWADHWVSGKVGVVYPPMYGTFVDGVGTFTAEDLDDGIPVLGRGIWDSITPSSCRWHQASSGDNGATWDHNWFMQWTRRS